MEWLDKGRILLLNDNSTSTRLDLANGLESTLDLGLVSLNLRSRVTSFEVDGQRNWTQYAMVKQGDEIGKKFTDHLSICIQVKLPAAATKKNKNIPVINMRNK